MAFEFPDSFRFADSHEYAHADGELVRVGISAFAVDQLGDIVFVDLPEVGSALSKGGSFGSVESVKAVEDMYSPLDGEVVQRNEGSQQPRCRTILTARDGCWWCVPRTRPSLNCYSMQLITVPR